MSVATVKNSTYNDIINRDDKSSKDSPIAVFFKSLYLGYLARDPDDLERIEIAKTNLNFSDDVCKKPRLHPELKRLATFGWGAAMGSGLLYSAPSDVVYAVNNQYLPNFVTKDIAIPTAIFHTLGVLVAVGATSQSFLYLKAATNIGKGLYNREERQKEMRRDQRNRAIQQAVQQAQEKASWATNATPNSSTTPSRSGPIGRDSDSAYKRFEQEQMAKPQLVQPKTDPITQLRDNVPAPAPADDMVKRLLEHHAGL